MYTTRYHNNHIYMYLCIVHTYKCITDVIDSLIMSGDVMALILHIVIRMTLRDVTSG